MKTTTALGFLLSLPLMGCLPSPATAQAVRTIYTVENAILCGSPFNLKEGKTAAAAGDAKWLAQIDCGKAQAGLPAIVIGSSLSLGFFKVRLQGSNGEGVTAFGSLQDFVEPRPTAGTAPSQR